MFGKVELGNTPEEIRCSKVELSTLKTEEETTKKSRL